VDVVVNVSPIETVEDALAVARLVQLAQRDHLPLVAAPRNWLLAKLPDGGNALYLATCPVCLAVWVAAAVVTARAVAPRWWGPAARVLAAAYVGGELVARQPL